MIELKKSKEYGKIRLLRNKKILFIIPIMLFNAIFLLGAIIFGFINSFGNEYYDNGWFINNKFILFDSNILNSLKFTFRISVINTAFSMAIALVIIYIIFFNPKIKLGLKKFLYLPILTPYLLIAFFMMYSFSTSGFLNRLFFNLGIINSLESAPIYINDLKGKGIVLAYLWKTTPFVIIVLLSTLDNFDKDLLKVSSSLGANRFQNFIYIILPFIKKSIFYSGIIIFSFVFSAIEIPMILGPTRPQTLSVWAYENFKNGLISKRSMSLAINSIVLIFNIVVMIFLEYKLLGEIKNEKAN